MTTVAVLMASDKDLHSPRGTQNYNLENTIKKGMEMLGQPAFIKLLCASLPEGYIFEIYQVLPILVLFCLRNKKHALCFYHL